MNSMNFVFNSGALIFLLLVLGSAFASDKSHGEVCDHIGFTSGAWKDCKDKPSLLCYKTGTKSADESTADTHGVEVLSGETGVCLCNQETGDGPKTWIMKDRHCGDLVPKKAKHNEACTKTIKCEPDELKCSVRGTASTAATVADILGSEVKDGETGKCLCSGKKNFLKTKCVDPAVHGTDTGNGNKPNKGSSGSDPVVQQSFSLQLVIIGAGIFLVCSS